MEAQKQTSQISRVKLGSQGLEVSKLGFGCMNLSGAYGSRVSDEDGIAVIKHAFNNGITFLDTSDIYGFRLGMTTDEYGPGANEFLLGKALKQLPREKIQLATKFGIVINSNRTSVNGKPEYVRACCEASLERLRVDYIDLYYQHRIDQSTPIEETVGELKKLVEEGKVKYIGLSEASPDTIRRAHAVHPITAVQMEWSLTTRNIEDEIVPLCRELGIGIVAYSPLGRGFLVGMTSPPANSLLATHPRFTGDNFQKNRALCAKAEKMAAKYQCTTAQLALAWLLHQGDDVVPIPGTTKIKNLDDNIGSLKVRLTHHDLEEISNVVSAKDVAGDRSSNHVDNYNWPKANTPLPSGTTISD